MNTIRRWYILGVSAVSLQCVTWATIALLRNLLLPDHTAQRNLIAFQIAVIIIGLPLFLVHWLWAQRLVRTDEDEQRAMLRWVYLFGLMASFLLPFMIQATQLGTAVLRHLFGVASYELWEPYHSLAGALVYHLVALILLAAVWAYHWQVVRQSGAPTILQAIARRVYVLAFAALGLLITAVTAFGLLQWLLYQIGTTDWRGVDNLNIPAETLSGLVVWSIVWLGAWRRAQQLFARYANEQASALRKLYLYGAIFAGIATAVVSATLILAGLFRAALDLLPDGNIRDPLTGIIIGVPLWAYHAYVLRQDEHHISEQPQQASVRRLYYYLVAGVGLGVFLIGLGGLISVGIRAIGGSPFDTDLREQLAWFAAALLAGLPVWLIPWRQIEQAAHLPDEAGDAERRSQVRKIYLYIYLFAATMTALVGAIYLVSQLIELLLQAREATELLSDVGQAIAFMLIAVAVWVYHGRILRADNRQTELIELARLQSLRVAIIGEAEFAAALQAGLQAAFPSLLLTADVAEADVVVGDWRVMGITAVAHKLIIPTPADGTDWIGAIPLGKETAVKLTADALKQIALDESVQSTGPSISQISGYVVLALVGFSIVSPLIIFVIETLSVP